MPSTHAARHRPVHPGEILHEEFLVPLGISMYRLAKDTGMPADRVGRLVRGTRAFSADTAPRPAAYFRTTAEFWMNLQARYDLEVARDARGEADRQRMKGFSGTCPPAACTGCAGSSTRGCGGARRSTRTPRP